MDKGTAIICGIIVLICVVPFILMKYFKSKKEKNTLQILKQKEAEYNCRFNYYEFSNENILALDTNRKALLYIKNGKVENSNKFLELQSFKSCQIANKTRNIKSENVKQTVIEKIDLIFIPKDKNGNELILEIYDESEHLQLSGEFQFAEKWVKLINDLM